MKKLSLFVSVLLAAHCGLSQNVDYNKIILPSNATNVDIPERLVQLAWRNHPLNHAKQNEADAAEYNLRAIKSQWLNMIVVSGNMNEFNIDKSAAGGNNMFYPRYNFGISVPLGVFGRISNEVKREKEFVEISGENINAQKLIVRQTVIQAYNDYLKYESIYKIRAGSFSNATNTHLLIKEKFKNGEVSVDSYSNSENTLAILEINKIEAETDYKNAKLALEQMIGMKLEDAIN